VKNQSPYGNSNATYEVNVKGAISPPKSDYRQSFMRLAWSRRKHCADTVMANHPAGLAVASLLARVLNVAQASSLSLHKQDACVTLKSQAIRHGSRVFLDRTLSRR